MASINVCVWFGVLPRKCRSLNYSNERTLDFFLLFDVDVDAMKKSAVYMWVKSFSEGREGVTDEERSGRPATSRIEENITKVRHILHENRLRTVRTIAEQLNIDRETVRKILTEDLDMRKVCAKMVPKELTEEQKQRRVFSY